MVRGGLCTPLVVLALAHPGPERGKEEGDVARRVSVEQSACLLAAEWLYFGARLPRRIGQRGDVAYHLALAECVAQGCPKHAVGEPDGIGG